MKKKRILSMLLAVVLVISGMPVVVFASNGSTNDASAYVADTWIATSGAKELTVEHIDESTTGSPNTLEYYHAYNYESAIADESILVNIASNALKSGTKYRMYVYLRSAFDINEAFNGNQSSGSADVNNQCTLRVLYSRSTGGNPVSCTTLDITHDWTCYPVDFVAVENINCFEFRRHFVGGEDVVPFDIDGVYFIALDASGNETGAPIYPRSYTSRSGSNKILTVNKAESFFDKVVVPTKADTADIQTVVDPEGLGYTVKLTGSDDTILTPGEYELTGSLRLGWFDHSKIVLKDKYLVVSDNNTAALDVWVGSDKIDTLALNPNTWTPVNYVFELDESTPMSHVLFEMGEFVSIDYKNLKITKTTAGDYKDGDGNYVKLVNDVLDTVTGTIGAAESNEYVTTYDLVNSLSRITYTDSAVSLSTNKEYELTVWLRRNHAVNTTGEMLARVAVNDTAISNVQLTEDWQKVTATVKPSRAGALYIRFWRYWTANDVVPYDIDGLSLVDENGNELIGTGTWTDAGYDPPHRVTANSETPYFHADSNTVYATSGRLDAGVYNISGDFRIGEFDISKVTFAGDGYTATNIGNKATLSAFANGTALRISNGETGVAINTYKWTNAQFKLVVGAGGIDLKDIRYVATDAGSLDFKNLKIEDITYLCDTTFTTSDSQPIGLVTTDDDTYVSIVGRDNSDDWVTYTDTTRTYTKGTSYTISFMARTKPYIKSTSTVNGFAVADQPAKFNIAKGIWDSDYLASNCVLASEWQPFNIVTDKFAGVLFFCGTAVGFNVAPIDIKNFKITETGSDTNLAANGNGLYTDGAGWAIHTDRGLGIKKLEVFTSRDYDYLEIPSSFNGNTSFNYTSTEYLQAGVYHIIGDYILNEAIDYNKYTYKPNDRATLTSDENIMASLSVNVGGDTIKTLDGQTSISITKEKWTSATFKFIVAESNTVKYSDIVFLADGAVPVGIRNYAVVDMSDNYGGEWESNDYELVQKITENGETFYRTEVHDGNTYLAYNGQDTVGAGVWLVKSKFRLNTADDAASAKLTATLFGSPINAYLGEDASAHAFEFVLTNDGWVEAAFVIDIKSAIMKSDIRFQLDTGYSLYFGEISFADASALYDTEIYDSTGIHPIKIGNDLSGQYISVSGRADNGDKLVYSVKGLETGTYTVTFKARTKPYIESAVMGDKPARIRVTLAQRGTAALTLTHEWQTYGPYTAAEFGGVLEFYGSSSGYGFAPFDIKDLVITKDGESNNLAVNSSGKLENGNGWSINETRDGTLKSLNVSVLTDNAYNRVFASQTGNTELNFSSDEVLVPGIYNITGNFRLGEPIDYGKYESEGLLLTADGNNFRSNLSAMAGSASILNISGAESVALSDSWTEATFVLDLATSIKMSDVYLILDDAFTLEYYGLKLTLVEKKVNLSDVNTGIVVTLLALKAERAEKYGLNAPWNGLTSVDKVLDESTGKIGDKDGANANTYIRVSGRDSNNDLLVYENKGKTLTPGTYTVSFWARSVKIDNASAGFHNGRNPATVVRLFLSTESTNVLSIATSGAVFTDPASTTQIMLGENWLLHNYTFKIDTEMPFKFMFKGSASGFGVAPFDIDGFTVTAADSPEVNLAINSDGLINSSGAGWSTGNVIATSIPLKTEKLTESTYMTTGSGTDNTVINSSGATIKQGKYFITTKVRISNIDYLKYNFVDGLSLRQDNNKATLTATLSGKTLKTTNGADSFTVTPEWGTVSFVMNVEADTSMKKIMLALDSNASLDFDYINIDTEVNTIDEDALEVGELPPLTLDASNLLVGAVSEKQLGYWDCGDQTLKSMIDENGDTYLAASNISSNTRGFIYKPGFTIQPGTYKFTAQVRTTNGGEEGMLRVMIGNRYASTPMTNEWRTVELKLKVDEEMDFTFKLRGGPVTTSVQDYEIKNMTLVNVYYVPANVNLYANSTFDNADTLSDWRFGYGTGKLTVNTEDGNSYLTVSDRGNPNESDIPAVVNVGFVMTPGDTYTISYDIRTSVKGETMHGRTALGLHAGAVTALTFSDYVNDSVVLHEITDTWKHVEHTFTATSADTMYLWFRGGPRGEADNKSFDIDNLVVMRKDTK